MVGKSKKKTRKTRYWNHAIAKLRREGRCRLCKSTDGKIDAAHIIGRKYDQPLAEIDDPVLQERVRRHRTSVHDHIYVHPLSIVPLCAVYPDGRSGCHYRYDANEVAIYDLLTDEEKAYCESFVGEQGLRDIAGLRNIS